MASLLVDLHLGGVYWGDCSLANTLFRRSGDRIQAYLVDAETSEVHATLSMGQRAADLEVLVENVAYGLADLALMQDRREDLDDAAEAARSVHRRYDALWNELTEEDLVRPGDRQQIRARIRRLNDLGFAVDEIVLEPGADGDRLRVKVAVTNRRFHVRELQRLTGIGALERQAAAAQPPRVRSLDRDRRAPPRPGRGRGRALAERRLPAHARTPCGRRRRRA